MPKLGQSFIHEHFMLQSKTAEVLYHQYVKDLPIIDYHCHVSPYEIAENRSYSNIAEVWLHGDHYKWRALRAMGVSEEYITGSRSDKEKFLKWAEVVPHTMGNPLYHWTHLELKRYFGVDELLSPQTAEQIWVETEAKLATPSLRTQGIIAQSNVELICTTDDPSDRLEAHVAIEEDEQFLTKVLPTYRPDKAILLKSATYQDYLEKLGEVSGTSITSFKQLLAVLKDRALYFHEKGCRLSDHGIETIPFEHCSEKEAETIFQKALEKEDISFVEERQFQSYVLLYLGQIYHQLGWTMQLHLGALRNNNTRMFHILGPDTGYDSMGDFSMARDLNGFLNALDTSDQLPKTIIYTVNPIFNEVIASAIGNFQSEGVKGKVQFGSGWWFNDQKDGMEKQMKDLANIGLLSVFVGMLTDSRSFLSYTRHEYFRRILCNMIGKWVEDGEVPNDEKWLGQLVQNICYDNAKSYFGFDH
ncbi:glucuronate isomerase [Alkalihalobacillus pseudalcaliphilus]|uniref:glucuronate isomerase n=1 Tax=Alkalihalobacillus pseudalcaliphilus TaxID=79884 RepID=UPI00064D7B4C|nr:glucuronate isomerase [Alkalihalobacillus pseudalcaliphilus]KMK74390.1 glucuronate isomerase [Alkalihalobacillus pseudalcaliphilus]